MKIEINDKRTEAFSKEIVNTSSQYRSILKKPEGKLKDQFMQLKIYCLICVILMVIVAVLMILWRVDALTVVAEIVLLIVIIFSLMILTKMNRMVKQRMEDETTSVLTLDKDGVEMKKETGLSGRMDWGNVAFVRSFNESITFFSADSTGMVISVPKKYEGEILNYIKQNNISVKTLNA